MSVKDCWLEFVGRQNMSLSQLDIPTLNSLDRGLFTLCSACKIKVKDELNRQEEALPTPPKKYILKEGTFIPPIPKETIKNYQDREPGEEG